LGVAVAVALVAAGGAKSRLALAAPQTPLETPAPEIPQGPPLPLPQPVNVVGPTTLPIPAPIYLPGGGFQVSEARALTLARSIAQGPITQEAIRPMLYRHWVAWKGGARTYTIDLNREVYLVVLSAPYQPQGGLLVQPPCGWIGVLLDGVEGFLYSVTCGQGNWPTTLPPQFSGISHQD
jgi:hypothetical protein